MTSSVQRAQAESDQEAARRRRPDSFEQTPSEAEADAVGDAFLHGAGGDGASLGSALASASDGVRTRAVSRLQQQHGNAYVQRLIAWGGSPRSRVQRQGGGGVPPAPAPAHGPDLVKEGMWEAGVVEPISQAQDNLKAPHPSEQNLTIAKVRVDGARDVVATTFWTTEAQGADHEQVAGLATLRGSLTTASVELNQLLGHTYTAPHIRENLGHMEQQAKTIEKGLGSPGAGAGAAPTAPAQQSTP